MRFRSPIVLLSMLLLGGCSSPATNSEPNVYYDVLSYVQQQTAGLSAQKPLVHKAISINAERSQQDTRAINWSRELDLFTQADINKPALRSSYLVSHPDSLTYKYELKNPKEYTDVHSLLVQLDAGTHKPRRIEATMQTNNPLYISERHLLLESGPSAGREWRLQHYRLSGFQKLPFFDRNDFVVDGTVQSNE